MNCDPIARFYRWMEYAAFGRELERRRFRYLADVRGAKNVLMLGEGDGRFLARFAAANPQARVDYIDASARMLELARARAETCSIRYLRGDALVLVSPQASYDLIVTHFFLDCLNVEEQEQLTARLADAALPHARWLISEFRRPRGSWRAVWARLWLRVLYTFFGVTTHLRTRDLADHRPILAKYGFRLEREETSWFGLLGSEVWERKGCD